MKTRIEAKPAISPVPEFFSPHVGEARRFYLDIDPPRRKPLTVVSAGVEQCAPDYAIHRDTFRYFCIEYVARGRGELTLGGQTQALRAGDVFSYGPGMPHEIKTDVREPLAKYFVDFVGLRASGLLKSCGLASGRVMRVFPLDCLATLYDELIRCGLESRSNTGELCAKLLECIALKIASASTPSEEAKSRTFAAYLRCRAHIEQHYLRLKTLQQIADECEIDGAYICRLFRRFDHQSPYQYLVRLKVNRAVAELQKPGALVKDAAAIVGFTDTFHFSRLFHHVVGSWPSEFRQIR